MYKNLLFSILLLMVSIASSQTVEGVWKTIDDESGKPETLVKIYLKSDKMYGQITKLFPIKGGSNDGICHTCTGKHQDKPLVGMLILEKLEKDGDEWEGDKALYYPKDDKYYDCKVWLDKDDKDILYIRGYWGFLYRTQKWHRVKKQ